MSTDLNKHYGGQTQRRLRRGKGLPDKIASNFPPKQHGARAGLSNELDRRVIIRYWRATLNHHRTFTGFCFELAPWPRIAISETSFNKQNLFCLGVHYARNLKVAGSIADEASGFFLTWPNPSSHTKSLGSSQPLTEMSTSNLRGGESRPERKADNLTAICEAIV
jgi:hypothetical protein